jgi:glycine/D-amino acid oxidase-like deaminating enzyme
MSVPSQRKTSSVTSQAKATAMTKRGQPYWLDAAPPVFLPQQPVPATADVAIMGAGYTGLSAAITLARAGRCLHVFDKMRPGGGASTRSGGITSGNLRPSHSQMSCKFSEPRADGILAEPKAAREDLYRFIADEKIDCDFATTGRFFGASAPGDYDALARDAEALHRTFGIEA